MKKIMLLFVCLFTVTAFAQVSTDNINKTDSQGRKQGIWKKYEKGKLVYEGQFKDNIPFGTFKYYHPNGKLKSETEFQVGVHIVRTTIYHENGHKASEGMFVDQVKNGEWRYYANTDTLIKIENYLKGKRTGSWKTFSAETGVLLEEISYSDGKMNGVHKTYYTDGTVSLEENYVNGKQNGKCTAYYPKQLVSSTGNMLNGFRVGNWDFYDVTGKLRSTMEYKDQKLLKTYVYLYTKGKGQKINQDAIAYFMKEGDKSVAVMRNGNKIIVDETLDEITLWADFMIFTRIAPSILASTDAIVGYKEVEGGDNDAIIIKLNPSPGEEIYAEGREAKLVKSLFNKEMPKE